MSYKQQTTTTMEKKEIKRMNVLLAVANWQHWFERFCMEEAFNPITAISTFMSDFTIADFGNNPEAVKETYGRVKNEWLKDYKYWTELVCVLNHKSWLWAGSRDSEEEQPNFYWVDENDYIKHPVDATMSMTYASLYEEARDLFYETYEGNEEATTYFFEVTD